MPVAEPVYPFRLRYEPNEEFKFPDHTYDRTIFEYLQDIPVNSVLYTVHALDKPEELGGVWQEIAELVSKSPLVPSLWGDQKMLFRHYK